MVVSGGYYVRAKTIAHVTYYSSLFCLYGRHVSIAISYGEFRVLRVPKYLAFSPLTFSTSTVMDRTPNFRDVLGYFLIRVYRRWSFVYLVVLGGC